MESFRMRISPQSHQVHEESQRKIIKIFVKLGVLGVFVVCLFALTGMAAGGKAAHAADKKKIEIIIDENGDVESSEVKPSETKTAEAPPENPGRFAPDFCDFEITFPEKPLLAEKCIPGSQCFNVNSYTMVYDLQTTVDVSVTCTPSTPAAYKQYTDGVMKAALAGMIDDRNLTSHDIKISPDKDNVKSAAITGVGKTGTQDKIYSAQLWIGQNSVFSVQAELIGSAHDVADKSFRDILQSIKRKDGKQIEPPAKPAPAPKKNNQ